MRDGASSNTTAILTAEAKKLRTCIADFLFIASRQLSLDVMGSIELVVFAHCAGDVIYKIKALYLSLLPKVYEVVSKFFSIYTGSIKIGF